MSMKTAAVHALALAIAQPGAETVLSDPLDRGGSTRCGRGSRRLPEQEQRLPMQAAWNGRHRRRRGKHYFPPDVIESEHFEPSSTTTVCRWKGIASYYTVVVEGGRNEDAALVLPGDQGRRQERRGPCRLLAGRRGPLEPS